MPDQAGFCWTKVLASAFKRLPARVSSVTTLKWFKPGRTDKHFNRMRPSIDPCKNPHST